MSFENGEWKIWRDAPGFSQRFVGKFDKERKIIKGYWEKSVDGKKCEHDVDLTYTRE
jgi:hypothetical protein